LAREPWSPLERHERFEEFARALEHLLREPRSNLAGRHYPVVDSRQIPGPVQQPRPPLYLSALGPRSLALTAELADGWVSFGDPAARADSPTFDAVSAQVTRLNSEMERRGRDERSLHRVLLNFEGDESPMVSYESFLDWAGRYRALGFDEVVVHWPVSESPYAYDEDLFERICVQGAREVDAW
jgi:hypothetical protein